MTASNRPNRRPFEKASVFRWISPARLGLLFLLVHIVAPWGLSFLSTRHGWTGRRPGRWNLAGLVAATAGITGALWTMSFHLRASPRTFLAFKPTQKILTPGPYAFSRNPMYLFELAFWLGWAVFYGSFPVLVAVFAWVAMFRFVAVPWEERDLEARFGETYLRYKNQVPRWLGRPDRGEKTDKNAW